MTARKAAIISAAVLSAAAFAVAAIAWGAAQTAPGAASGPAPDWMMSGVDASKGPAIYEAHCSACHDHPTGRTPPRSVIAANTAAFIYSTLTDGIMAPYAAGLDPKERMEIALAVSTNKGGGSVDRGGGETRPCDGPAPPLSLSAPGWYGWGDGERQARFQARPGFTAADTPRLKLKWAVGMNGQRNGQPVIAGRWLFTSNTAGAIYALDARTGCSFWRFNATAGTRTTIALAALSGARDASRIAAFFVDSTGNLYALNARTGAQLWKTRIDTQFATQFTGSPVVHDGIVYAPVSSAEEALGDVDTYECCKFRGALVAVDAASGRKLWETYTTATPPAVYGTTDKGTRRWGPAGGAIWSSPSIDARRGVAYVATGNSYTDVPHEGSDSIIAVDLKSGAIRWTRQLDPKDRYLVDCIPAAMVKPGGPRSFQPGPGRTGANCPKNPGGDYDFGMTPILHTLAGGKDVILAGQKSSQVYALDPDAEGKVLWTRRISPGGPLGGIEFGGAAGPDALYVGVADLFLGPLAKPGLSALRASDGELLWTTPSPKLSCRWSNVFCDPAISMAVSAMPGVVFAGSMNGRLRAYDAKSGKVIWEVDTQSPAYQTVGGRPAQGGALDGAGPVIANGMVYVHSGYLGRQGPGGTVLLAYSVDGK